jgi:hypothetical protein
MEIYYTKPNNIKLCGIVGYIGYRELTYCYKGLKDLNIEVTIVLEL